MNNFKRRTSFLLSVLLILSMLTVGCRNDNTPEARVDKLFASAKKLDFKGMEEVIEGNLEDILEDELDEDLEDDYEKLDRKDYIRLIKDMDGLKEAISTIRGFQSKLDYEILEVKEREDQATVIVDVNYVDGSDIGKKTISTVMTRIFSDSISDAFVGAFSKDDSGMDQIDEEAEFKKYMQIVLDAFNESAESYEPGMTSNVFEIKLKQDEEGEWLITEEGSDSGLLSALFFNFIDLEAMAQFIEKFS